MEKIMKKCPPPPPIEAIANRHGSKNDTRVSNKSRGGTENDRNGSGNRSRRKHPQRKIIPQLMQINSMVRHLGWTDTYFSYTLKDRINLSSRTQWKGWRSTSQYSIRVTSAHWTFFEGLNILTVKDPKDPKDNEETFTTDKSSKTTSTISKI